ncbi:hypothetical protein [Luteimicrobium subarcticum]|uniref:GPI inositol-deacylase PGAP1-like alpha/beta domain-containing protein n=1 Tax=Luteimicrobium subarcticum TaxID=620910 RepID=A0A2M8WRX4_9MICO|nr:hypothetical protein [Luteimicrobium subarcticum]PJI93691.1 hypothetical protein CLV34_1165 [Luteimicrobium subarcticum]
MTEVVVTGGYTQAETDSFRAAAEHLRQAQLAAEAARSRAVSAVDLLHGVPSVVSGVLPDPGGASRARARAAADAAVAGLGDLAERWAGLRTALLRAGHLYEEGEDLVGATLRYVPWLGIQLGAGQALGGVLGTVAAGERPDLMTVFRTWGDHTEDLTAGLGLLLTSPVLLPWASRVPAGAATVGGLDTMAAGAEGLLGHGPGARYELHVEERSTTPDGAPLGALPVPTSVEQALRQVHDVSGAAGPGTVAVQRVGEGPDARWVVVVPGTQTYDPGTTNPLDGRTDVALVAGRPNDAEHEVLEAMRGAGVPAGASVVIVGHSLGGIAAARLAANPRFRERYDVRGVVTAGSPVGGIHIPSSTTVLSVENTSEGVSGLEGAPNPASPDRVTVQARLDARELADAEASGQNAHDVRLHADVLDRVRRTGDPALDRTLARLDALLGADDPSAPTRTWYFTGERR